MGQEIHVLRAIVSSSLGTFVRDMNTVAGKAREVGREWWDAGLKIKTAVDRTATAIAGLATTAVVAGAKMGGAFLSAQENAEIMFETLYGDAQVAKQVLNELLDISKRTPFAFSGIRAAAVQLANAKVAAQDLPQWLNALGNAVAAVGGSDDDLKGVAIAISQMMTSGRANAQDMLQLVSRGIPAWDMLADRMGATVAQVRKLAEDGQIDGRTAAMAIMAEATERFGGAMDKLSTKWSGLWSTMIDTVAQQSAVVFEPLFEEGKRTVGQLTQWLESGGGIATVASLRAQISDLVGWWQRNQAGLLDNARAWGEFLKPIAEYLIQHPDVLAALVALKVTGLLGINQALLSVAAALMKTIPLLGQVPSAGGAFVKWLTVDAIPSLLAMVSILKDVVVNLGLFRTAILALQGTAIVAGFMVAITVIREMNKDLADGRENIQQTISLLEHMQRLRGKRIQDATAAADDPTADPMKRRAALQQRLDQRRQELNLLNMQRSAAESTIRGQESQRDRGFGIVGATDAVGRWAGGIDDKLEETKATRDKLQQQAARVAEEIAETQKQLDSLSQPAIPSQGVKPVAVAGIATAQDILDNKAKEKDAKAAEKAEARNQATAEEDFARFAEDMRQLGVTGRLTSEQVATFTDQMRQLAGAFAAGSVAELDYEIQTSQLKFAVDQAGDANRKASQDAADASRQASGDFATFSQHLRELGSTGELTSGQARGFAAQMHQLAVAMQSGRMAGQDYKIAKDQLEFSVKRAAEATRQEIQAVEQRNNAIRQSTDTLSQFRQRMGESFGSAGMKALDPIIKAFGSQLVSLQDALRNDTIGIHQFKDAVAALNKQAEKAAELERKKLIASGQFGAAGFNLQEAILDRLVAFREQQWNQAVDGLVGRMYGIGQAMQPVIGQFGSLAGQIQQFGQGLASQIDPKQAFQQLADLFNSNDGQIALLYNNIQQLYQNLQIADTYQAQARIVEQIKALESELSTLTAPQVPILTASVDPYADPGLQRSGGNTINISVPNVNRLTNSDAQYIADVIGSELDRRGNPAYS